MVKVKVIYLMIDLEKIMSDEEMFNRKKSTHAFLEFKNWYQDKQVLIKK